jgi:hypothetical protein
MPINFSPATVLTLAKTVAALVTSAAASHGFNIPSIPGIPGIS